MPKFTKRFVETLSPPKSGMLVFWDSDLKGFGIVILPSGRKTYCVQYRNAQRVLKRLKIGVHGQVSTEQARLLAKKQLGSVSHGEDPVEKRKQDKRLPTFPELAKDYLERHASSRKRPRGCLDDQKLLIRFIIPAFKNKTVDQVTRREVETLHLGLAKTPYQANRVLALLSKLFSCAMAWGWCAQNPVKGIARYPEEKRDRWLNQEELDRLWAVLDRYPHHLTAYVFKFLLLTGARKGEVLQATWDQFNFESGV